MGLRGGGSSAWLDLRWFCGIRQMAGVPITHGAQVGFPTGAGTINQTPDHVLAEKFDEVAGDASFQVQRRAVLEAAAFAGLAHGSAFDQHKDGGAVARRVAGEVPLKYNTLILSVLYLRTLILLFT